MGVFQVIEHAGNILQASRIVQYHQTALRRKIEFKRRVFDENISSGSFHNGRGSFLWPFPYHMHVCEPSHRYSIFNLACYQPGGSLVPLAGLPGRLAYQSILGYPCIGQRHCMECIYMGQGSPNVPRHPRAMQGPLGL